MSQGTPLVHLFFGLLVGSLSVAVSIGQEASNQFPPFQEPPALGAPDDRVRVIQITNPEATRAFDANAPVVRDMVRRAVTALMDAPTEPEAWRRVAEPGQVVGIKVFSRPGATSGTRIAVVEAVVQALLTAGHRPDHIIVWDRSRAALVRAGYEVLQTRYGIEIAGSLEAGFSGEHYYETSLVGKLVWGDLEFGKTDSGVGRRSHLTRLLTERIDRIIQISPMLNHNRVGVSGNLYGLAMGSVDNTLRFESDSEYLPVAAPEILAMPKIRDKMTLHIVDALICQYEGEQVGLLHYSVALNQLRFSRDPVALDVLSLLELRRQRERAGLKQDSDGRLLYENAALLELGTADPSRARVIELR